MCNDANSWVDLDITEVTDDGMNINVDGNTMSNDVGLPALRAPQFQLCVGCDQLTEEYNDQSMKFPVTPWTGGISNEC